MSYTHVGLARWPFPVVPDPEHSHFIADRRQLREDFEALVRALTRQGDSSIHLLWSWYGAGKTHTLYHLAYRAAHTSELERRRLTTVYSEFPKSVRSFLDLYRAFAVALDPDVVIDAFLEISTAKNSDKMKRELLSTSPDLAVALQVLAMGTDVDQVLAMRWLRGEALPAGEYRRISISQKIGTSDEASRVLAALVKICGLAGRSQGRDGHRLVWLLDEFQRIEKLPERVRVEINTGLHSTFNACPNDLSMFLSFSGRPQPKLPAWFSDELRDRIGRTKVLILPPLQPNEAMEFVKDVLFNNRTSDMADAPPYFPFTEDAARSIIDDIQSTSELKPRSIMHAFGAVLREAEAKIETGELKEIGADLARRVLKDFTALEDPEEDDG